MSKKEEYNVVILSRAPVTVYPKLNVAEEHLLITYVAAGLPPNTLNILKKDWTAEKEKQLIRMDIIARLMQKTESYRV
jgi:hypothetical protein